MRPKTMAERRQLGTGERVRRVGRVLTNIPGAGVVLAPPRAAQFAFDTWRRSRRPCPDPEAFPAARLSWALAAQVALDETILGVAKSPRWYPKEHQLVELGAELQAATDLAQERGWLDAPATYHRDPPPLTDPAIVRASLRGLRHEVLSWPSEYEPHEGEPGRDRWMGYTANATAHARVLRHPGADRPWLLCLHGFGTGTAMTDFYAFRAHRLHRELGLNVMIPVLPMHGMRKASRIGGIEMMSFQLQNFVLGMSQAMWDIRRLLGWARGEGAEVIGVHGMSFGGYTAALLSALHPGLDMVIAGAPLSDIPRLFAAHGAPRLLRAAERHGADPESAARALRVVSPLAMPSLVPRERLYMYAGVGDRMSRPEQAQLLWEHWGRPRIAWYEGSHMTFIWTKSVATFLDDTLVETGFVSRRRLSATAVPAGAPQA
jgi:dienelactone hydrolase